MMFHKFFAAAAIAFATLSAPSAHALTTESALAQATHSLLACAEQPYRIDAKTGRKAYGAIRSRCAETVRILEDRVEFTTNEGTYTFLIKESESSDGGDLNDLYLVADGSTEIATNVLSFSDPALAVLLIGGHTAAELPQVRE